MKHTTAASKDQILISNFTHRASSSCLEVTSFRDHFLVVVNDMINTFLGVVYVALVIFSLDFFPWERFEPKHDQIG
jgi:hypothetical protein